MASEKFHVKQIPKEIRKQDIWSRRAFVDWVNHKLKAHFTNALEFRNGAMYVQLFDSLFPGIVPMDEVKFSAHTEYDCYQNFRLLEDAFKKLGIQKDVDTHALSSGRHVESWAFLKWFKLFYDINFNGREYDPVKARKNAYMGFGRNTKTTKLETPTIQSSKRNGKLLPHARSKSMVFQKDLKQGKDLDVDSYYKRADKTCRSVECLHHRRDFDFGSRPISPLAIKKYGNGKEQISATKIPKSIQFVKKNKDENQSCDSNLNSSSSTNTITDDFDIYEPKKDYFAKKLVPVPKDRSHGDFEHKVPKITEANSNPSQCFNVNAIVVNKRQTYEEFGVRITENIQIRIESTNGILDNMATSDYERRQKINLMIEEFLKYQWVERKEYFQSLAEFLRKDCKNTNK